MSTLDPLQWLSLLSGAAIIGLILYDVFGSVLVPRLVSPAWRLSAFVVRTSWARWRAGALYIKDEDGREDALGRFAPAVLVALLINWLVFLLIGYGLVFYAMREHMQPHIQTYIDAVYFAGTSLLTIGYGDIVATGTSGRFAAIAAAATGLALFGFLISFIFSIFSSFQRREVFVVAMGSRTGAPPSGVTMLETAAKLNLESDLATSLREAESWAAAVLESHLAYPILAFFRSSHDDESWIGTLGALLDACTMIITLTDSPLIGHAKLFHVIGVHLTRDLSRYFNVARTEGVGIERQEFDAACAQLAQAGVAVRCDDAAWQKFSELRTQYAGPLNDMAHFWLIPPTRWIGDRSTIGQRAMHAAATK
jgi:hypothetical protein